MDDPNVVLRASTCYSLSIPFSNPCPFIFLLMLGNNSKDGKVMWEMNDKREQLLGFNLQHERTSFLSSASSTIGIRRDMRWRGIRIGRKIRKVDARPLFLSLAQTYGS